MTAVTRFAINNQCPVILGDLILSGPEKPGISAKIPTIENVRDIFPSGSGIIPYSLQQKIVVIGDNLVIGWSGDYLTAKEVIRDIYAENKITPFTKTSLHEFFTSLPQSTWDQGVGFLGFIKDQYGIANFGYRYESINSKQFGNVGFLGTGTDDLKKLFGQFPDIPTPQMGNPNILEVSVSFALAFTGALLNYELATYSSLRNFYGGGYEIASLVNGKFCKVSEIVYVFWVARVTKKSVHIVQVPRHAISFTYVDDILTIRSVSFDEMKDNISIRESGYGVLPMYRLVSKQEIDSLKVPDLNQKWLCNHFLVTPPSGVPEIYGRIDYRPRVDRCIKFIEEQSRTIVAVEKDFIKGVGEEIYRRFNS